MAISREEIAQIATRTADEVMERIREQEHDSLMLHSLGPGFGDSGIVVDEARAKASPCRCIEYQPGKKLCFSKGIVGALSDEQEMAYCPTTEALESPGLERRLKDWMGAVEVCKAEIESIPKGERLEPWLRCMSRELETRGIEASESPPARRLGIPKTEEERVETHARLYGSSEPPPPRGTRVMKEKVPAGV